jgi:hypothetical protein
MLMPVKKMLDGTWVIATGYRSSAFKNPFCAIGVICGYSSHLSGKLASELAIR